MESIDPDEEPSKLDERFAYQQLYATHDLDAMNFEPDTSMAMTTAPFHEQHLPPNDTDWNQFQPVPTEMGSCLDPMNQPYILPPTDPAVLLGTYPAIGMGIGPSNKDQMNQLMNDTMISVQEQGRLKVATAPWPGIESMIP